MDIRREVCIYSFCIGDILKPVLLSSKRECGVASKSGKNGREPVFCCRNETSSLLTSKVCLSVWFLSISYCVVFYPSGGSGIRSVLSLSY